MNISKMVRALVLGMLASVLVYAVLAVVTDAPAVATALGGFSPAVFVALLGLSSGCYLLRATRWGLLMRTNGYPVRFGEALYLALAGQTMSISPGRVGEIFKPWLARDIAGMPMSRGIALVFGERVADLIAGVILALGGLYALGGGMWTLVAALGAIIAGTAVASSEWFHRMALGVLGKQQWARKHAESAAAISDTIRSSLSWKTLSWSTALSILAWGLEGIGFALSLRELGFAQLNLATSVSVYAVATIIGAFTFLPGGIGITEASMAGILTATGMAAASASAATLITRVVTLWWAILLGWLMIASRPAIFRRLLRGEEPDA
jgi:uncharacterized protein (TIRG00374 family)